jgi:hypothetical protein
LITSSWKSGMDGLEIWLNIHLKFIFSFVDVCTVFWPKFLKIIKT